VAPPKSPLRRLWLLRLNPKRYRKRLAAEPPRSEVDRG